MISSFGAYQTMGDCPLDTSAFLYSQASPYDMGAVYDGAYNDVVMNMGTAGAYYRASGAQQLARMDAEEPVYAVPLSAALMRQRKL